MPLLNEFCTTHEECIVKDSVCRENKCQCKFFTTSVSNRQCIPLLTDKFCYNDNDCRDINHTKCSNNQRCTCVSNYIPINNTVCAPLITGHCVNDNDCITANSFCFNNTCQCKYSYRARSYFECKKVSLGDSCNENSDCEMIANTQCSNHNKKCICDDNSFAYNKTSCIPMIGKFCSNDSECDYDRYHCFDNKCQCLNHYLPVSENQCVSSWVVTKCNNDTDCGVPWHWECSKNKRCSCKANNTAISTTTCLPLIGGYCWKDDQCVVENSFCIDFHCRCVYPFIAVANNLCRIN
ncbi:rh5-interacting protein-like [Microplitis mediator]|uniref:rh5-interacting protein-like n=1 Tax=Microplitis mediator TaxID=375433 RepID=UPI0025553C6B|nr:rh5-interacting protein-like [Microplitis mediator]